MADVEVAVKAAVAADAVEVKSFAAKVKAYVLAHPVTAAVVSFVIGIVTGKVI